MTSFFSDIRANLQAKAQQSIDPANQLNQQELASLLEILKRTTFLGEQIEFVYGMVLKLQNQYLEQSNNT